jgi:hypothetical protein
VAGDEEQKHVAESFRLMIVALLTLLFVIVMGYLGRGLDMSIIEKIIGAF